MYEGFYGFRERAFRKTPDPRFLFLSEAYEEALEQLLFAVEEMELALLTGEVGAGKTLLTRALVDRVGERHEVGMILNPRLSPRQFLAAVAAEIGVTSPKFHAVDLHAQLQDRLVELDEQGRGALLIVDEAHLIPERATFEEIRLLTNFQLDDRNLISVLLVGQPELRQRLRHKAYRALTQRIGAQFHLPALAATDVPRYLAHRVQVAGGPEGVFEADAAQRLHEASGGVPRVLNQLATQALIEGMARGRARVGAAEVDAVCENLDFLDPLPRRADVAAFPAARR